MMRFILFMIIWIGGCFIADTYLIDAANAWVMAWGAICAGIGFLIMEIW